MTMESRDAEAGFALAEVLVAFAIVSLTLIALFQGFGLGVRGIHAAEARAEALSLARSKLDRLGLVEPLQPGITHGAFPDGQTWRLDVTPFAGGAEAGWSALRPYRVRLAVSSRRGGGDAVVLETILLFGDPDAGSDRRG